MVVYETMNNMYVFKNGRVTCPAHSLWNEPTFGTLNVSAYGLKFRTAAGWWYTTPVVRTEVNPQFVLA